MALERAAVDRAVVSGSVAAGDIILLVLQNAALVRTAHVVLAAPLSASKAPQLPTANPRISAISGRIRRVGSSSYMRSSP